MGSSINYRARQALLSVLVIIPMVFGTFFIGPVLPAGAALGGTTDFEIGLSDESLGAGTESQDIVDTSAGGTDWLDLPDAGGTFDEGEVKVINDQNFTGSAVVMNPEDAAALCLNIDDDITKGGTKIDHFPFPVETGASPNPGKNDICQVYVSYEFVGGDTIAYIGVVRRETGGTTAVALELNKTSHSDRQVDDLLIMFEFDGSGPISSLAVRDWDGSTWGDPVPLAANEWGGTSWEYFGEVAVDLSATELLPPPTSVDDCDSFSSLVPYGVAGNSTNSNVGDWGGIQNIDIPRCGQIEITKIASPAADASFEFDWELSDNAAVLTSATGTLIHGQTTTFDVVQDEVFTLAETSADSPYVLDLIECVDDLEAPVAIDAISVGVGESVSCTIYNESSAVVVKKVGDGNEAALFDFSIGGNPDFQLSLGDTSDTYLYVPGTSVTVTESLPGGVPAWDLTGIACVDGQGGAVPGLSTDLDAGTATFDTIAGETITCTYTNEQDVLLTLVKHLDNDFGGNADLDDFDLSAEGPVTISGTSGEASITNAKVEPGSYTLDEDGPIGYTQVGDWSCIGGDFTAPDQIELDAGDSATCTVSNIDEQPTLTVVKEVNNDHGGLLGPANFPLYIDSNLVTHNVPQLVLSNTEYVVSEDLTGIIGYQRVGAVSCSIDGGADFDLTGGKITLDEGEDAVCTITNEDIPATLTLLKTVITDDGGDAVDTDWTLRADGPDSISGSEGDTSITSAEVLPGDYDLSESGPTGYAQLGNWSCGEAPMVGDTVSIVLGQEVICEVTNDDIAPGLTVVKEVINDDGGAAVPGDFQLYLNGAPVVQGVAQDVLPNVEYTVTEDNLFGYSDEGVVCRDSDGIVPHPVTLSEGDAVLCTYTNDDIAPSLTLEKVVINDGGGEAVDTDWTLSADGPDSISGVEGDASITAAPVTAGDYVLSESFIAGYAQSGDWDCGDATVTGGDTVTLGIGDVVTCTVTNSQLDADLAITKDDLVDPIVLTTDGPVGEIEYQISVTNLGPAVAKDVIVTDTLPASVTFVSAVAGVGSCTEAGGVVTCSLGDMEVGDVIGIVIVVETETLGELTDLAPENVVEVGSITPDPDPTNNVDNEVTEIIEVEDIEILPFTGLYGDFWFMMALLLMSAGALVLFMNRVLKDSDQAIYPG